MAVKSAGQGKTEPSETGAASPIVAAAFIAGIVYMWSEAFFRLIFTYTSLAERYVLWNGRVGDIAAMWLTMSVVSLLVFIVTYGLFRGRSQVGSVTFWTILLVISAIVAPLVGEIGTPIGI